MTEIGCVSETGAGPCADGVALEHARAIAVSPDGRTAYVAATTSNAVAVLDRAADGSLVPRSGSAGCVGQGGATGCASATALDQPVGLAISPDGSNVYVASTGSDAIAVLDRAADGTLTQRPGSAGCVSLGGVAGCASAVALDGSVGVAVSPDGRSVYAAASDSDAVVVFDRHGDGTLTQKAGSAGCVGSSADGCVPGAGLNGAFAVAVSPDGTSVYVGSRDGNAVTVFDRAPDGTLHQKLGPAGCVAEAGNGVTCASGSGLAWVVGVTVSPDGRSVYGAAAFEGSVSVFDRAADGSLTQKPGAAACFGPSGYTECTAGSSLAGAASLAVSPDGRSAYVAASYSPTAFGYTSSGIAAFDRAADGSLTQKPGAAGCVMHDPVAAPCARGTALEGAISVAVSPDGRNAYVAAYASFAAAAFDLVGPPPPAPAAPPAAPPPPPPAPLRDTIAPVLRAVRINPSRFAAAGAGHALARRGGGRVSWRLSEPAVLRFTVERARAGRRVGGRCLRPTIARRRHVRCMRWRSLPGAFTRRAAAGKGALRFSGRLRGRALTAGQHRLIALATDDAGNDSHPIAVAFRIIRRR